MNVQCAPFVPAGPRPALSDREVVQGIGRRARAASARRYNLNTAADIENPNTELSRTWQEWELRGERRVLGRGRVNRMLADASLGNDIAAYRRQRGEALGVIARAQMAALDTRYASRGSRAERERLREAGPAATGPLISRSRSHAEDLAALGYGQSSRGGCPPCRDCHYVICRCGG
jgi:hypothetical protein